MTCYRCFSVCFWLLLALAACAAKAWPAMANETPAAAATPAPQLSSGAARVNYYRRLVSLPGITVDQKLDDGAAKHARYVLENHLAPVDFTWSDGHLKAYPPAAGFHKEDENNHWYTPEGARAAGPSDVFATTSIPADGGVIIDQFMTSPVNALATLDFEQSLIGFGSYCKGGECIAVAAIGMGLPLFQVDVYFNRDEGHLWFKSPLEFPPPGTDLPARPLADFGYLDALTACPGYTHPAGAPILLSLGQPLGLPFDMSHAVHVSAHSLLDGGQPVEHCAFDTMGYANPDAKQRLLFRVWLNRALAVVMIPRKPLEPGHTYDVSMTVESKTYKWSFKTAPAAAAK